MDPLAKSLSATIAESKLTNLDKDIKDVLLETSEAILDKSVGEVVGKAASEIPIIKTLLVFPVAYHGISSYLLIKKIIKFLTQLESVSSEERRKFLDDLESKKKKEILEGLMLILEKHDNYKKSEIQGKLFKAFILKKINEYEYLNLTHAVSNMNINTLPQLSRFYSMETGGLSTPELIYSFISLQLVRIDNSQIGLIGGGGPTYQRNRLGMLLVEIVGEVKIPQDYKDVINGKVPNKR